jgi:hypothetical protein
MLDTSIQATLEADDAPVPRAPFLITRRAVLLLERRYLFAYDELPDLEVVEPARSEPAMTQLARWIGYQAGGPNAPVPGGHLTLFFDVRWRTGRRSST